MFKPPLKLVAAATALLTFFITSASAAPSVTWDFSSNDLQGWTLINGIANYEGDGINPGFDDSAAGGAVDRYAHDGAHTNFVVTSPGIINFSDASATDPR